jgi:hypothetical protein
VPSPRDAPLPIVVVFPADYEAWIRAGMIGRVAWLAPVDRNGEFSIGNFRPGQYLIAAVDGSVAVATDGHTISDHEFVRRAARGATPFTAREGDNRAPALRVVARGRD